MNLREASFERADSLGHLLLSILYSAVFIGRQSDLYLPSSSLLHDLTDVFHVLSSR